MNKSLIPLFFILIFGSNLIAQNLEPIDTLNYPIPTQTHFMLGWHWGASRGLSTALGANQKDVNDQDAKGYPNFILNGLSDSNKIMITAKPPFVTHCFGGSSVIESYAIQYEPTLLITDANKYQPDTSNFDNMNPVFGFRTINNKHIVNDSSNHQSWLLINNSYYNKGETILDNPWVNDQLYRHDCYDSIKGNYINNNWTGDQWFISLNIKRSNSSTYMGDDSLIEISMPCIIGFSDTNNYYMKFDTIPSNIYGDYDSLAYCNRGAAQNLSAVPDPVYKPTKFYIRPKMLPLNDSSITISARFTNDVNPNSYNNPIIRNYDNASDSITINKINIRVVYWNASNCPLQINWIRIETPHSRKYFYGVYDQDLLTGYKNTWNHYNESEFKDSNDILFRFNNFIEGGIQYWAAERYLNKLVGNLSCGETSSILPYHYEYFVRPASRWLGMIGTYLFTAVPFVKINNDHLDGQWKVLGFRFGYKGKDINFSGNDYPNTPIWNSYYETWLNYNLPDSNFNKLPNYQSINFFDSDGKLYYSKPGETTVPQNNYFSKQNVCWEGFDISLQAYWESRLYQHYYFQGNEYQVTMTGFQYSDLPWWSQVFPCTNLHAMKINTPFYDDQNKIIKTGIINGERFLTGEEMRLFSWNPVIMGAKGLMVCGGDDGISDYEYPGNTGGMDYHMGKGSPNIYSKPDSAWNWLNDNLRDGRSDYFQRGHEGGDDLDNDIASVCDDTIAKYYGTTKDRIFIGRRSMRTELKKIYDWINSPNVGPVLMKLKLQAWYGKGYAAWYNQHPDYGDYNITHDAIMKKFIDFEHISTKKIFGASGHYNTNGILILRDSTNEMTGPELWSESLYDVTLLKHNDKDLKDEFYIGIQNRRTDPLRFYNGTMNVPADLYFIPSAELFDNAKSGTGDIITDTYNNPPLHPNTAWWRDSYFQQLGSREITIPFSFVNTTNPDEYCLLKVSELGWDDNDLNNTVNHPWRASTYYQLISPTIIGQDGKFTLKLLPGEGKLLKVEVLHPPRINGNLAHSNQSKLVCYPAVNASGVEVQNTYRYHLVYFKPLPPPNQNKNGVYYRTTTEITRNTVEENIIWNDEICVSEDIKDIISTPGTTHYYEKSDGSQISCDYPSIVLRKNYLNNHLYAYIVYSCASCYQLIVETMIDVTENSTEIKQANVLSTFVGDDHSEWGNPVINASSETYTPSQGAKDINFYAWSDQNLGIVAGAKLSSWTQFATVPSNPPGSISKINIHWKSSNFQAKHPSLNVYSHINNTPYEDNCALVWQEPDASLYTQVFYTRLRYNTSQYEPYQLIKYLPPNYQDPYLYHVTCINNIAFLSDITVSKNNTFPVVFRSLDYQGGGSSGPTNRLDRVYWESRQGSGISNITLRPIDLFDDNSNNAVNWSVYSTSLIYSQIGNLFQPNITQGYPVPNSGPYGTGLLLDCKLVTSNSSLIELAHNILTLVSPLNPRFYYIEPSNWVKNITSVGNIPHLDMHYNVMSTNQSWLNRRVYNLFDPNPSTIMTSAKFAYRQDEDDVVNEGLVGFRSDSSNYLIYLPTINNQTIGLNLPFKEVIDSLGNSQVIRSQSDTVYSEWFPVGDMSNLNFKCKGFDTTKIQILLQKRNNGQVFNLELPELTSDTLGKLCCNILFNGMDNEYRLLMINRNPLASYSEELWLGGLPADTMQFLNKAGVDMGYDVVDLGDGTNQDITYTNMTLSIRPNPADEVVYVRGLLPASAYLEFGNAISNHKIKYQVYSQIGCIQMTAEGLPGETVSINTSNLPAGVYFISAEHKSDNYFNPVSPVVEPFVISR